MSQQSQENSKRKKNTKPISYPLLGLSLPINILLSYLIGHFLDKQFGTTPVLLIIFILLGVGAGYMQIFKLATRNTNKKDDSN